MTRPKAPNVTAYLLAHYLPFVADSTHLGAERWTAGTAGSRATPLPYVRINRISGADDEYTYDDEPVVSVHFFGDDFSSAMRLADDGHEHMRILIDDPSTDVVMADGSIVNANWVQTIEKPTHQDYGDTSIRRFVGRYRLSLHFA